MTAKLSGLLLLILAVGLSFLILFDSPNPNAPRRKRNPPALQISPVRRPVFSPDVRVNVTPASVTNSNLAIDGRYTIQPVGNTRVLGRGNRLPVSKVEATSVGLKIGSDTFPITRLEVIPQTDPAIWVGNHQYRGRVRIYRQPNNKVLFVNVLPLENYIASVVNSEMPATFPTAARQAQAIAARTYALFQMQAASDHPHFDLFATTRSQRYLGFQYRNQSGKRLAGESSESRKIVEKTAGTVCTLGGKIFCTYYSAVCGGRTTAGKSVFPYSGKPLQSVICNWCRPAPLYRWQTKLPKPEASQHLKRYFSNRNQPFGTLASISAMKGKPEFFQISDGQTRYEMSSAELRQQLTSATLPSPHFTVESTARELIFHGRGHGHGVGLCQWGARGLAMAGKSSQEIIEYYYPGGKLIVIDPSDD